MRMRLSSAAASAFALAALVAVAVPGQARAQSHHDDAEPDVFDRAPVPALAPLAGARDSIGHFMAPADLADVSDAIDGEIVVDVRDDATATDIADLEREYGLDLEPNSAWSDAHGKIELARVVPMDEEALLVRLARDPRVEAAEPMSILRASFVPNDPLYASKQWHLQRVGAERAWEYACGQGVTVAVIDTGIACFDKGPFSRGTDLTGTRCGGGYNFVDNSADAYDDQGHGTHVAGTIAQTTHNGKGVAGLAHCAKLMPVKVLNRQGWGTVANVAEGIRFAADNGAQVINLSLGGNIKSRILEKAVRHALGKGVTVVAAAGNSGRSVGWPAAYDGVVAVSATDSNDKIAWFSSRGSEIAIGAPGVAVTQQTICDGGRNKCELFGTFNGTSMASPHVAGAAAMVVGLGITDPESVRDILGASAVKKDDASLYGAGILDAGAAAARAVYTHLAVRLLALFALGMLVARRIRKKGGLLEKSPGFLFGALLGGVGLFPVAGLLHLGSMAGHLRWVVDLVARPVGEWDLVLDAGLHKWLPLANAAPALVLALLFFGVRKLRPTVGGFALGTAALLAQIAWSADVAAPFGGFALRLWVVGNAAVCLWLARVALDTKRA